MNYTSGYEPDDTLVSFGSRSLLTEGGELVDNAINELGEVFQSFENRLSWKRRVLAKRYCEGSVKLLAEFDVFCGGHRNRCHAIFNRAEPQVIEHCESAAGHSSFNSMYSGKVGSWNEGYVFIGNVEVVDGSQRMIPSFVRLQRADYLDDIFSGSIYVSTFDGTLKSVCRSREGEVNIFGVAPVQSHKVTGQKIEGGTEVMNGVSDNPCKFLRHLLPDPESPDVIRGVRVLLDNDIMRVTTGVGTDLAVQITDMAFCPTNL